MTTTIMITRTLPNWKASLKRQTHIQQRSQSFPMKKAQTIRMASDFAAEILQDNRGLTILIGSCLCSAKLSINHETTIKAFQAFKESKNFPRNLFLEIRWRQKWFAGNMDPNKTAEKLQDDSCNRSRNNS